MELIDLPTFDMLRELAADQPAGWLAKLLLSFRTSCARRMDAIRAAREAGDWKTLGFEAHALKSSCASIGALALRLRCGEIETIAKRAASAGDPSIGAPIAALLDALPPLAEETLAALAAAVESSA